MARKKRRIAAWILRSLIALGAITIVYQAAMRLAARGPDVELNVVALPFLAIIVVALSVALAGILVRNLVRLLVERKRGILGSRLRSKLVFSFLGLVLAPALLLFSGSAQLIKKTVEGLLRTPVVEISRESQALAEAWAESERERLSESLQAVAAHGETGDLVDLARTHDYAWVAHFGANGLTRWASPGQALGRRDLETRLLEWLGNEEEGVETRSRLERVGEDLEMEAAAPAAGGGWWVAGRAVSDVTAARLEHIAQASRAFDQFRVQRKDTLNLYLYLIALIFLVTLFAATWLGFYLARRITEPIQELAAASREISAGNLSVRVNSEMGDEVGMLVESFNEMTAELQESREVITRSTADLRRSNLELDDRRRYVETLVAHISAAVISVDREGHVTTANPAVKEVLGMDLRPGDELSGALASDRLRPLHSLYHEVLEKGLPAQRGHLTIELQGNELHVAARISPLLGARGQPLGTLLVVEDLSDLLQAQKAAAWREVARRVAHEIKNPLTPIQLAAERLEKKFRQGAADLERVVPEATGTIVHEVGVLKRLVNEFSRYARLPDVRVALTEFKPWLNSVLKLYQGVSGVDWVVHVAPELDCVRIDQEQFRRVLINLIDNALAAMGGQGSLTIEASVLEHPGSLRLTVSDEGPGIPMSSLKRLFQPDFSTKKDGGGLGLAIVQRIVHDHAGTIRVEPNLPRGARFILEIPGVAAGSKNEEATHG